MPSECFDRINLDLIELNFLTKVLNVIARCKEQGAIYHATQGFRSYGEQKILWCQGRTTPGKIVTNAKPGQSAHNFGLAIDFVRIDGSGKPSWLQEDYRLLGQEAGAGELLWGGSFSHPDSPHLQVKEFVTAEELLPIKEAFENNGLKAAWLIANGMP